MKVIKNDVSYFEAGMRAGMILMGTPKEAVDQMFYSTTEIPNLMRMFLREYGSKKELNSMEEYKEDTERMQKLASEFVAIVDGGRLIVNRK